MIKELIIENGIELEKVTNFYTISKGIKSVCYYKNGKLHREKDKPAVVGYYTNGRLEYEKYCKNGMLHREGNKPAEVGYYEDGRLEKEYFYLEGQLI